MRVWGREGFEVVLKMGVGGGCVGWTGQCGLVHVRTHTRSHTQHVQTWTRQGH